MHIKATDTQLKRLVSTTQKLLGYENYLLT